MIHPEEIRSLVRQGRIPENGRVIRGSGFLVIRYYLMSIALLTLIPGIVSLVSSFGVMSDVSPSSLDFMFAHAISYMDLGTFLFVLIIIPLILAIRAKESAMVFFPDRCVQFTSIHSSNPSTYKVLRYAWAADIQLKVGFWTGGPRLVVRDHEGKKEKWYPDPCFGDRGRTLQDILIAYNTYTIVTSAPYLARYPLQAQVQ